MRREDPMHPIADEGGLEGNAAIDPLEALEQQLGHGRQLLHEPLGTLHRIAGKPALYHGTVRATRILALPLRRSAIRARPGVGAKADSSRPDISILMIAFGSIQPAVKSA